MVSFTRMWDDVFTMIDENETDDMQIVEKFKSGIIVQNKEEKEFITKDDFIDFWCKLLYYNELSIEKMIKNNFKLEYIYSLINKLPYISESEGILKLVE